MKYRFLGKTGMKISEICIGCMTFEPEYTSKIKDEKTVFDMLDNYADQGGNFFDMANNYPGVEELFGKWLGSRSDRDKFIIATKVRFPVGDEGPNDVGLTRKHLMESIDRSLKKIGTDYIDLYQMHCWDEATPIDETLRVFDDITTAGKIRYAGASNFAGWHIMKALSVSEINKYVQIQSVQMQYNLLTRSPEWEILPVINEHGLSLTSWSPLAAGWLSGKYKKNVLPPSDTRMARFVKNKEEWDQVNKLDVHTQIPHPTQIIKQREFEIQAAQNDFVTRWRIIEAVKDVAANHEGASCSQVALAWLLAQPGCDSVVTGVSSNAQMDDNLKAMDLRLTEDELDWLNAVSHPGLPYPFDFFEKYGANRR